jgi:hypothetical protein
VQPLSSFFRQMDVFKKQQRTSTPRTGVEVSVQESQACCGVYRGLSLFGVATPSGQDTGFGGHLLGASLLVATEPPLKACLQVGSVFVPRGENLLDGPAVPVVCTGGAVVPQHRRFHVTAGFNGLHDRLSCSGLADATRTHKQNHARFSGLDDLPRLLPQGPPHTFVGFNGGIPQAHHGHTT